MASNSKNLAELLNSDVTLTATDIANGAVTTDKLADGAVTQVKTTGVGRAKNLFYNGAMQIAQRSTSAVTVSDNSNEGYSTVDRWKVDFGSAMGGALVAEPVGSPSGNGEFERSLKLSCSTVNAGAMTSGSTRFLSVAQYLEGKDLQHLAYGTSDAKTTTYSFWVYTNKTGRYGFSVIAQDSSNGFDVYPSYFDVTTSNTWQKITFTVPGNTSADIINTVSYGFLVDIYLAIAANRAGVTDSTWQAYSSARVPGVYTDYVDFLDNTSNVFFITGIQLEVGDQATPFDHRSYGEELSLCQRYYFKSGQQWMSGQSYGVNNSQDGLIMPIYWPTTMRANPSVSFSGGSDGGSSAALYTAYVEEEGMSVNLRSTNAYNSVWWSGFTVTADSEL